MAGQAANIRAVIAFARETWRNDGAEREDAEDWIADEIGLGVRDRALVFPATYERGGFIGRATLTGVVPPCSTPRASLFSQPCDHKWHMPDQFGFRLANVSALPFLPFSGSLGFFRVPDDVRAKLERGAA
jgi:hypothetical protein